MTTYHQIELERAGVDRDILHRAVDLAFLLRETLTGMAEKARTDEARDAMEAAADMITDYVLPELSIGVDNVEDQYRERV